MARPTRRRGATSDQPPATPTLRLWLQVRARSGAIGNAVVFLLVAATAASRAAHGVLSPAGLVAVVAGAAAAATATGWVAGFYEGVSAGLQGEVDGVLPAHRDHLAGRHAWRVALGWAARAALWAGAGAVVLAAVLRHQSAPTLVILVALLALAVPAVVLVDVVARAAGAAGGAAQRVRRPANTPLLQRAWRDLALPAALVQVAVNAGVAWLLFQGDASEGTLTRSSAFGDALLMSAVIAGLFGALGARWGSTDVAAGRIVLRPEQTAGRAGGVGPQALVYAVALTVTATSLVGLVVPPTPSIVRVALVRGLLAGALTLLACALGVVRGAMNATPLDLGARPDQLPAAEPMRPDRGGPRRIRLARVGAGGAAVALLVAVAPLVGQERSARAGGLDDLGLVAELDAFGVRVEYDIPLPAGTGSAPQVVGTVRRTSSSEVANGIAAAPTRFDAVVGGTLANADKERKGEETNLPQAECAFPGALTDVVFAYPSDVRPETADVQPIGHAAARCGAGPSMELDAVAASTDDAVALGPGISIGGGQADARSGPVDGVLRSMATARATDISILDGLVRVGSVVAGGASRTDGGDGGAATSAHVDLIGVAIAGTTFDVRDGDLVVGDTTLPLGTAGARALLREVRAGLAASGCDLTVLDEPSSYPQGFLFTRPTPELGIADDGSRAASMAGGLLVECDLPQDLTTPTGFNPQRIQVGIGFAFTSVAAAADIGGFGIDDLLGEAGIGGTGGGLEPAPLGVPAATGSPAAPAAGLDGTTAPAGSEAPGGGPVGAIRERIELLAANFAADRPWVWLPALGLWALLGHRGIGRARREIERAAG